MNRDGQARKRRQLHIWMAVTLVLSARVASRATEIKYADFAATTPNGYTIRTNENGKALTLLNADRGITVELYQFAKVPDPSKEAVGAIMRRYRNTDDVSVLQAEPCQQHGASGTYAEGSAQIDDVESRFWFLAISLDGQAVAAVAHADKSMDEAGVHEIKSILRSVRSRRVRTGNENPVRYFDFEMPGLSDDWSAQGEITITRGVPPHAYKASASRPRTDNLTHLPDNHAVRLQIAGGSGFYARAGVAPRDWTDFESVSFWVFRDEDADRPTTLELQALEPDTRVRFWRKVVIDHDGWKRYTVALPWMRWGEDGLPSWNRINRFGFWFRDEGDLWIDSIALEDLDDTRGALLTADDVTSIAFPANKDDARVLTNDTVTVITSTPDLDIDQLANHLQQVKLAMTADLSFLPLAEASYVPKLVVAPTRDAYRKFVTDFATAMNSQIVGPASDGFTLQGVATSYWDPRQGNLRPVYTHEFVHAAIDQSLRFGNKGEWLHEGLATYYQLKFHPQKNFNEVVQQGLVDRRYMAPFARLCSGDPIPMNRYWQAMTLVDMLLVNEDYRRQMPKFVEAIRSSGSSNLEPVLQPLFGKSWEQLTDDWRNHCQKRFPVDGVTTPVSWVAATAED